MNFRIRSATIVDAANICDVVRRSIAECCIEDHRNDPVLIDAWLRNKTPKNTLHWLQNQHTYSIVAEVDGAIVGFAMSIADEVLLCYAAPEVRFKGVGKSMLQALELHAAQAGFESLRLESTRTANNFYTRNGFIPSGPAVMAFGMEGQPMAKAMVASPSFQSIVFGGS